MIEGALQIICYEKWARDGIIRECRLKTWPRSPVTPPERWRGKPVLAPSVCIGVLVPTHPAHLPEALWVGMGGSLPAQSGLL